MAASLIVGVLIGQAMLRSPGNSPITSRNGQLLASGTLANALSDQLAGAQTEQTPVKIGVSFKSKTGDYCRTFTVREPTSLAGLACHNHDDWQVQMLAQTATTSENGTQYRQAGSDTPRSVVQAVEDTIAGDPLDAHAEAAARDKHWSP